VLGLGSGIGVRIRVRMKGNVRVGFGLEQGLESASESLMCLMYTSVQYVFNILTRNDIFRFPPLHMAETPEINTQSKTPVIVNS
jgi:hypothetical protein